MEGVVIFYNYIYDTSVHSAVPSVLRHGSQKASRCCTVTFFEQGEREREGKSRISAWRASLRSPSLSPYPVKEKDSWIPKMVLPFGRNKLVWREHHGTKLNAIGLTQSPYKAMDAESGVKLAFLPDRQQSDATAEEKSSREFLVLYHKYGASLLDIDSLFAKTRWRTSL